MLARCQFAVSEKQDKNDSFRVFGILGTKIQYENLVKWQKPNDVVVFFLKNDIGFYVLFNAFSFSSASFLKWFWITHVKYF